MQRITLCLQMLGGRLGLWSAASCMHWHTVKCR